MNKVICVLKSGGEYLPEHVLALRRNFERSLTTDFRFEVLSDISIEGVDACYALKHNWPGWWSKVELFRPGLFDDDDRVVFVDLDTVLHGNADWLFDFSGPFMVVHGFRVDRWNSSLMAWVGQPSSIAYHKMTRHAKSYRNKYRRGGDQEFLMEQMKDEVEWAYWQRQFPGHVVSYKRHIRSTEDHTPPDNSVICFHGKPQLWDVDAAWITEARA